MHDQRCLEPQHPVAEASQGAVPLRISRAARGVVAAIHLDDEPSRRGGKIRDETPQHHLPAKPDPELPTAKVKPERLLGGSGGGAQPDGALDDDRVMSSSLLG